MKQSIETYRVRWASNGKFVDLDAAEIEARIRAGRIVDGDRIARADGVFVRWWEVARFAPLRTTVAAPASDSPQVAHVPDTVAATPVVVPKATAAPTQSAEAPAVPRDPASFGTASPSAARAPSPEAALRAAASRMEQQRSVEDALQRLQRPGSRVAPSAGSGSATARSNAAVNSVGTTVPAAAAWEKWIDEGPEAVRDAMMQLSVPDVLGVPESASLRLIQDAYEARKATIDGAWDSSSNAMKFQASRVAHFDLQRILAASLKVLTNTEERALYDRKVTALRRAPRLDEVMRFSVSATGEYVDPTRMSAEDEAVLKFAGFDTHKLKDAQPGGSRRAALRLDPNPPPAKRQAVWAVVFVGALVVAVFSWLPECSETSTTEGEFRVIAP